MLRINKISKVYKTGTLVQRALNGVSLSLRDSEFVAILGPSGSGKTTLLNIIGGLDKYDRGDLIINGVSTRKYSDRDWDSYRNHSVGFVFQSYNLIPHQTVLANVELALTISGISRRERTRRAREALEKVGLAAHVHKRPSQLSGGQMQRVAIARALVNNPSILLADEPTGALDSETSIQVMDLLREVARDRLVVMVTHNPELAEQYATRIVRLKDGEIISDSRPFEPGDARRAVHRNMGRSSMSPLTSLLLSFNNLWTKKTRTILVAFAGSIGIIGIAMILSLSTGVDKYIQDVEEETLQSYPLQITDTSFSLSAMAAASGFSDAAEAEEDEDAAKPAAAVPAQPAATERPQVRELPTVTGLLSRVTTNDLASLRRYLENEGREIYDYVQAIEYDYNLTPQIFSLTERGVRQVNPDRSLSSLGFFSGEDNMNSLLSSWGNTNTFRMMPGNPELYVHQYDVKAGRWPESYNECVLILTSSGRVTDMSLYAMGVKDPARLDKMVQDFAAGETSAADDTRGEYRYEDFLGLSFRLLLSTDYYVYDREYGVWTDRSGDEKFLRDLAEKAEELTIVGVVQPREDSDTLILPVGVGYPASLIDHIIDGAAESQIVRSQTSEPGINVFTGVPFGEEPDNSEMSFESLFSVDEDAIADAFQFDTETSDWDFSDLDLENFDLSAMDLSAAIDPNDFKVTMPSLSSADIAELLGSVNVRFSIDNMEALFRRLIDQYLEYAKADPATDYARLPDSLRDFLNTAEARTILLRHIQEIVAESGQDILTDQQLYDFLQDVMAPFPAFAASLELEDGDTPYNHLTEYLQTPEVAAVISSFAETLAQQTASVEITDEQISAIGEDLLESYRVYAEDNALPDPARLQESFTAFMATPAAQQIVTDGVSQAIDTSALERKAAEMFAGYSSTMSGQISAMMSRVVASLTGAVTASIQDNLGKLMESAAENLMNAFRVDADALAEAFTMNMDPEELRDLITSLLAKEEASYDGNLKKLGYADYDRPASITIYPTDFAGKNMVKTILNRYNEMQRSLGLDDKVISYTDMVDALMSSVTGIVDAIGYVLIAFVAISLVVSSVMIGVITYISVLERKKEIGILRAIGASKRNISQVFNAETFIIGALAGVFGIGLTLLLLIPVNHIIHSLTDQTGINAVLPPAAAVLLILLSIALTMIGGIIPSMKAARSDPVTALRSE